MNKAVMVCAILAFVAPFARGDDTWHNVYHSLKRFFTGSDKHQASSGSTRPRNLKRSVQAKADRSAEATDTSIVQQVEVHPTSVSQRAKASPTPVPRQADAGPTPEPRLVVLPEGAAIPTSDMAPLVNPMPPVPAAASP